MTFTTKAKPPWIQTICVNWSSPCITGHSYSGRDCIIMVLSISDDSSHGLFSQWLQVYTAYSLSSLIHVKKRTFQSFTLCHSWYTESHKSLYLLFSAVDSSFRAPAKNAIASSPSAAQSYILLLGSYFFTRLGMHSMSIHDAEYHSTYPRPIGAQHMTKVQHRVLYVNLT